MKKLKAGDIRQEGDMVRNRPYAPQDLKYFSQTAASHNTYNCDWKLTTTPGRIILAADLLHLQFSRP